MCNELTIITQNEFFVKDFRKVLNVCFLKLKMNVTM